MAKFIIISLFILCCQGEANQQGVSSLLLSKMQVSRTESVGDAKHFYLEGPEGSAHLEEILLNEKEAISYWQRKRSELLNLYKDYSAPYGGEITRNVSCPKEFHPQELAARQSDSSWEQALILYSNDRKTLGGCDPANFKLRVLFASVYCKKAKRLNIVRIYLKDMKVSEKKLTKFYLDLKCAKNI